MDIILVTEVYGEFINRDFKDFQIKSHLKDLLQPFVRCSAVRRLVPNCEPILSQLDPHSINHCSQFADLNQNQCWQQRSLVIPSKNADLFITEQKGHQLSKYFQRCFFHFLNQEVQKQNSSTFFGRVSLKRHATGQKNFVKGTFLCTLLVDY